MSKGKNKQNDISEADTEFIEPCEETIAEEAVAEEILIEEKEDRTGFPVYIVGANPLAYYMGAQLQASGEKVIILLEHQHSASSLNTDGISIKEDRNLTQKRHRLETSFLMKYPAKMVIITAYANNINTALSSISSKQIGNAPVVCFTPLKDMEYLHNLLGQNLHPAYFNGYLFCQNQTISVFGRSSSITICPPATLPIDESVISVFKNTNLGLNVGTDAVESFWEYFAPYALCSIFSAAENKKISELLKDKHLKEQFKPLVEEFSLLATSDKVFLGEKIIMKSVYNTPANYIYPLHQAVINGEKTEFNILSSIINRAAHKLKPKIPETNLLLKKLYNKVLETT